VGKGREARRGEARGEAIGEAIGEANRIEKSRSERNRAKAQYSNTT
jgi:hypothetical protein